MSNKDLKPCPICNGPAAHFSTSPRLDGIIRHAAHCKECGMSTPPKKEEAEAGKLWNQRSGTKGVYVLQHRTKPEGEKMETVILGLYSEKEKALERVRETKDDPQRDCWYAIWKEKVDPENPVTSNSLPEFYDEDANRLDNQPL